MLDAHSVRFEFPTSNYYPIKIVLLKSSYVELCPPTNVISAQQFSYNKNLFYPNKVLLLESFARTLLKEDMSEWRALLTAWAISYVYGELGIADNALDDCNNEDVKKWFNEAIRRDEGGMNRTLNKRVGRVRNP